MSHGHIPLQNDQTLTRGPYGKRENEWKVAHGRNLCAGKGRAFHTRVNYNNAVQVEGLTFAREILEMTPGGTKLSGSAWLWRG